MAHIYISIDKKSDREEHIRWLLMLDEIATPAQPLKAARLPAIEGLRGLAMTLVFFGHFEALFRRYLPADGVSLRVIEVL
jgi:hypothetical protein